MRSASTSGFLRFLGIFGLRSNKVLLLAAFTAASLLPIRPALAQRLPLFDAHVHYSQSAWEVFPPETARDILKRAGVIRAFISSTPDDGTLTLFKRFPRLVVPVLRPYRTRADMGSWYRDPEILAYVKERIRKGGGIYRGIGEFHMGPGDARSKVFREIAALAAREDLFLHAHVDAETIAEIAALRPDVCVLWAHAGMSSEPETISALFDRFPNLRAELALRWDISHDGLKPDWKALFLRHANRLMVGTDTWTNSQWESLPTILDGYRIWLKDLPKEIAEKIAYRNGERLAKPGACAKPQAGNTPLTGNTG